MSNRRSDLSKHKKKFGVKRKKRRDSYINSARPFAPEYSTSTISKAINLVYGKPELPSMSKYQDLPGTTHFNIFHNRTGVSNGNSELGHTISLQHDVNPHNHYIVSPGSEVSGATNVNNIYMADTTRAGDIIVDHVKETSPVSVVDTSFDGNNVQSTPLSALTARQQLDFDESDTDGPEENAQQDNDDMPVEGNNGNMWEQVIDNLAGDALQSVVNNEVNVNTPFRSTTEAYLQSMTPIPQVTTAAETSSAIQDMNNNATLDEYPNNTPIGQTVAEIMAGRGIQPALRPGGKGSPRRSGINNRRKTNRSNAGLPALKFDPSNPGPQHDKRYNKHGKRKG